MGHGGRFFASSPLQESETTSYLRYTLRSLRNSPTPRLSVSINDLEKLHVLVCSRSSPDEPLNVTPIRVETQGGRLVRALTVSMSMSATSALRMGYGVCGCLQSNLPRNFVRIYLFAEHLTNGPLDSPVGTRPHPNARDTRAQPERQPPLISPSYRSKAQCHRREVSTAYLHSPSTSPRTRYSVHWHECRSPYEVLCTSTGSGKKERAACPSEK
jgi:hypothetical protein